MTITKRSMIFIDAGNLFSAWWDACRERGHITLDKQSGKEKFTKKIGYELLVKELSKETDFIRGYYYDATPEPIGESKQGFYDMLRQNTITVVTKPLKYKKRQCEHCKTIDENVPHQKGVDVAMATDMMGLCYEDAYDLAIVVSGDNDFEEAVKYIKAKGKKVWVASFVGALGQDLMRVCDRLIKLNGLFDKIIKPDTAKKVK